ncbi:MAG: hypothetical protein ACK5Y2_06015 [Bdellovibrionales bacterium]
MMGFKWDGRWLLMLGLNLATLVAQAGVEFYRVDQHPAIRNPVWMNKAIQIQLTPRGQKVFGGDLNELLENLGVVINEAYFPELIYVSEHPISVERLAEEKPEEFAMLMQVRRFFQQYLKGIQFKDFRPRIRLGPSEYLAQIDRLALVADEELMKQLGKTDGAVFVLELTVSHFHAQATQIEAQDLDNPWLGQVGVSKPVLQIGSPKIPLRARLPFYVKVDRAGSLYFEALRLEENLDQTPVSVHYERLLLPEFEFKVAGQQESYKISLDEKAFKNLVDQNLAQGLRVVRDYVRKYLQEDFPKLLNAKAREVLKDGLEQVQSLPAAGSKPGDTRPPLSLGMKMSDLKLHKGLVGITLDVFAEDTSLSGATPFWQKSGARGAPSFHHLPAEQYDLAFAVDRAVFNRIVHLSFNRKNFKQLETCPGTPPIELLNPPGIDFAESKSNTNNLQSSLSIYIDALVPSPPEQTKGLLAPLKEKLRLIFQYQAVIRPVAPGSVKLGIYPVGVDLKTLQVDDSSLTWVGRLAKNKVVREIGKVLSNGTGCGNNSSLADFELINSLWGIPIQFVKIQVDPQGQLMLYMDLVSEKARKMRN